MRRPYISQTDTFMQGRGDRAAGHFAHDRPIDQDMIVRASHPSIDHLEADEPARNALGSFLEQGVTADEVSLVELDDPAESRLQGRGVGCKVITVKGITHFEAQGIACTQAN